MDERGPASTEPHKLSTVPLSLPAPFTRSRDVELVEFKLLQQKLGDRWLKLHDLDAGPREVVVVPSLSLDGFQLSAIPGINHYEERMLFTMGLLRQPRARLVYVTSTPLQPALVDYYLALIGGIPMAHVRERLTLLTCHDATPRPLTDKILERPRLIQRIRDSINADRAHLSVFTVSERERTLAVALGLPLYGVDPELLPLGTKSGSREIFREAGVPMPLGVENLRDTESVAEAVASVWEERPDAQRMVVKLNQGFSGEGNAILPLDERLQPVSPRGAAKASHAARVEAIAAALPALRFASPQETWERFSGEIGRIGAVVELYLEGKRKRSPSAQLRINPRGELQAMSTHDQLLGGRDGQMYLGCRFPADERYRMDIQNDALEVGAVLVRRGCVGRVAVDFVTIEDDLGQWSRHAIEINLRMTGTTHPIMTLKLLNDGDYDADLGLYVTRRGEHRYYVSTDTLTSPAYRGLLPEDLLDIAAMHHLHYRPWAESGVVFHLLGALSQYGKVGLTAIGASPEEADYFFERAGQVLDLETADPA
jgi:hypothetical protein